MPGPGFYDNEMELHASLISKNGEIDARQVLLNKVDIIKVKCDSDENGTLFFGE